MSDPSLPELIDAIERAGLRGHGGASFPTAAKLRAVAAAQKRPIVIVNGSEGEPLSRKDRFLLGARTDLVLDGACAAAGALNADRVIVAVDHRRAKTIERVELALAARAQRSGRTERSGRAGRPGRPNRSSRGVPQTEVVGVPAGFVTGQETALISFLGGGEAKPTAVPPYVFERGLHHRPTLVSNVETFAQIARVLAGSFDGTRHVTVSGAVSQTTVMSVAPSTTVRDALAAAGGVTDAVAGVLLGGYGGTWATAADALDLPLDEPTLRARGLTLGAGIVHVLGASVCPVAEVARVTRWMAGQSAGQCGPCVFGLDAIAGALATLSEGSEAGSGALAQLQRWCAMVVRRGGCAHPDGVARFVTSALAVFAQDFSAHATHGPCERCSRAVALAT